MSKSFNQFFTSRRIIVLSILFAIVMNGLAGWIVYRIKNDYHLAQVELSNTQVYDENKYYHYLKFFGSMDIRYKSDKTLDYDSVEAKLEFYRNSLNTWEMALDDLVSDIASLMSQEEAGKFSSSQKFWNDSKENLAQEASYLVEDSQEKNIRHIESRIDFTRARAYELLKNYKHILENSFKGNK